MSVTPVLFLAVLVVALAAFTVFVTKRVRYVLLGQPEDRSDQLGRRTSGFVEYVLGQKKLFKEPVGILHFVIFWGFIVIAFGALQIIGEGLYEAFSLPLLGDWQVFYLVQDVFIVLVIVAVLAAAVIRYVVRPQRFEASLDAGVILALIFGIMVAGLLYSGLMYAADQPSSHSLAPVTQAVSSVAQGAGWSESALQNSAWVFWWAHLLFILAFLVYIPVSKHLHLLACPVNEFFRNLKPAGGQIRPMDLEDEDVEEYGVSRIEGFTRWQLLDLYACAECGRCQDHCPAYLSGKSLSPKTLMTKLKDHLNERGPVLTEGTGGRRRPELGRRLSGEHDRRRHIRGRDLGLHHLLRLPGACPVQNEHVDKIVDMRRQPGAGQGEFPQEAQLACRNVEKNSNPWGVGAHNRARLGQGPGSSARRGRWAGRRIPVLGGMRRRLRRPCSKISQAVVKMLQAAGVSFAILGKDENCCGDPARRIGNEYLFQMLAQRTSRR